MLALDVAIIPPPDVAQMAERLSASLQRRDPNGLRLDQHHIPHITLTQQFVREDDLDRVLAVVEAALRMQSPLSLAVTGAERAGRSVWMGIERQPLLTALHESLMRALEPFERFDGDVRAFVDPDTAPRAVAWVARYRADASFARFRPHISLGHAPAAPDIERVEFVATSVTACHLGRFCSCRRVLRRWTLGPASTADSVSR